MKRSRNRKPISPIGDPNDPHGWHVLSEAYLYDISVRNFSKVTIETRRRMLKHFFLWAIERGVNQPCEVTKALLERYQRHLFHYKKKNGEPMSIRGQHGRLVPVRMLFKWLARKNYILYNPASELELPRLEQRLPRFVLTMQEAETVLRQPNLSTPYGLRDRAMLETFYSTGIRRMELINLKIVNLDVDRGTLFVEQGKGKKDRVVPIGDRAIAWIQKYLDEARPSLVREPDDGTLFLTQYFEPFTPDRLTTLVREYVDQADIGKRGSCHLFRHTMATLMLENGADTRYIQAMLGHARLDSTQVYTQIGLRKLKEIHTATHPAKLKK